MHPEIEKLLERLDVLSKAIEESEIEVGLFTHQYNSTMPALGNTDLQNYIYTFKEKVSVIALTELDEEQHGLVSRYISSIDVLIEDVVPNHNVHHVEQTTSAILHTLHLIFSDFSNEFLRWEKLEDRSLLPRPLIQRVRAAKAHVKKIESQAGDLEKKVSVINDAHSAAEALPTDLETLQEAKRDIAQWQRQVSENASKVKISHDEAQSLLANLKDMEAAAKSVVDKCEEAYRIATSTGLAASFDARAIELKRSIWFWVVSLIGALGMGGWLAYLRVDILNDFLRSESISITQVFLQIAIGFLTIGGPVWLAWLSTKQIGQRFKLAEDYAFKASVAKAYEGYRKEAASFGSNLEERLFTSALTRLEEMPLRLVEDRDHSSPWHELASHAAIQSALEINPGLHKVFQRVVPTDLKGLFKPKSKSKSNEVTEEQKVLDE